MSKATNYGHVLKVAIRNIYFIQNEKGFRNKFNLLILSIYLTTTSKVATLFTVFYMDGGWEH